MAYQTLIPQPNDDLDVSVTDIQQNFLTANTVMSIDHYPFDDVTANKGFHKTVTSPDQTTAPTTTAEPKIYGLSQLLAIGVLQYSRGPNDAIPTPITALHGGPLNIASLATSNIIDLNGLTRVSAILTAWNASGTTTKNGVNTFIAYDGGVYNVTTGGAGSLAAASSGTILQLKNNTAGALTNVYWTLQFLRIE